MMALQKKDVWYIQFPAIGLRFPFSWKEGRKRIKAALALAFNGFPFVFSALGRFLLRQPLQRTKQSVRLQCTKPFPGWPYPIGIPWPTSSSTWSAWPTTRTRTRWTWTTCPRSWAPPSWATPAPTPRPSSPRPKINVKSCKLCWTFRMSKYCLFKAKPCKTLLIMTRGFWRIFQNWLLCIWDC